MKSKLSDDSSGPSRRAAAGWTLAAALAMGVLGWARSAADGKLRLFAAFEEFGVLATLGRAQGLGLDGPFKSGLGFALAGALVPWGLAWLVRRKRPALGLAEAARSFARPALLGFGGLAVLAWFAGYRPPADHPEAKDYFIAWEVWHWFLIAFAVAGMAGAGAGLLGGGLELSEEAPPEAWPPPLRRSKAAWVMGGLALAYAACFCWLSLTRHWSYNTDLHDLGLYDQALWSLAHGEGFRVTHYAFELGPFGDNYLAEHFMPILAFLAPFTLLLPGVEFLLALQSLALGLAGWALFLFARREARSEWLALALGASFLLHPLIQQANIKDFHADALEPAFLFAALWARTRNSPKLFGLFLGGLFLCKEDASLMCAGLGVFFLLRRDWKYGFATLGAAAAYHVAAMAVISRYRGGVAPRHLYRYSHLTADGQTPKGAFQIAWWIASHPQEAWKGVAAPSRVRSGLLLLAPVGFVALARPKAWVLTGVPLAAALMSNWHVQYRLELHYGVASLMFIYAASAFALGEPLHSGAPGEGEAPSREGRSRSWSRSWTLGAGIWLFGALLSLHYGRTPLAKSFDPLDHLREPRHEAADRFARALPPGANASATSALAIHVSGRRDIFLFPYMREETNFLLLDTKEVDRRALGAALESGEWGLWGPGEKEGYLLLRRGEPSGGALEVWAALSGAGPAR